MTKPCAADYRDHPIRFMGSDFVVGKMSPDGDWRAYHKSFNQHDSTMRDLAVHVYKGHSFTPLYTGGRRVAANFHSAYHIAFDLDSNSIEDATELDWVQMWAAFAYTTPSHTPEAPRCRVVFIFDEPVTDADYYGDVYKALAWRFQSDGIDVDAACKDPLRLFYGSPKCQLWANWMLLFRPALDVMVEQWREVIPDTPQPERPARVASANNLPASFLQTALQRRCDTVANAPDGQKHDTLRRTAYALGGYIANGYYSQADVISALEAAIFPRAADTKLAARTIRDCILAGMAEPCFFPERDKPQQRPPTRRTSHANISAALAAAAL